MRLLIAVAVALLAVQQAQAVFTITNDVYTTGSSTVHLKVGEASVESTRRQDQCAKLAFVRLKCAFWPSSKASGQQRELRSLWFSEQAQRSMLVMYRSPSVASQ